ncbi:IclR family transcriptional regulator [Streptomyces sp. NPDC102360]|uniref:IclR family transcriptional regulator n=1 Tax=Streptomyces sp. NPDC102360 TaxID=3366160 RepID=UPI00381CC995
MADTERSQRYVIESLDTGLRLLRLFLEHDSLSVTDAARALGVARSTAHRVLSTLEGRGFVTRESSGRGYCAGPELVRLGRPAGYGPEARDALRPVLDDAAARTGETITSVALLGDEILITDGRESRHPVRVMLEIGRTHPAHATSGGKVLLARLTDDQVLSLYPDELLPEATPHTITSRAALLEELATVRELGYAVSRGESVWGMNAVAVPLPGRSWRDRMALMAATPADRGDPDALVLVARRLRRSALLFGGSGDGSIDRGFDGSGAGRPSRRASPP